MALQADQYKLVLGLEIHAHVKCATKMFCRCSTNYFGDAPNTHTCPTCLGLPGALPVPNFEAVHKAHILGSALNCEINRYSFFERKHYFYPDLPKGFQISQYLAPLCFNGLMAFWNSIANASRLISKLAMISRHFFLSI